MRKLNLLKSFISIFFLLQCIGIMAVLIFAVVILCQKGDLDFPININGNKVEIIDFPTKIAIIFVCFGYAAFVYGIYLFKQILELFALRIIFDDRIINNFNKIGKAFVVATVLTQIPIFILKINGQKRDADFNFTSGGFDSFLFTTGLALFFMVLSEVFKIAKNMKEENELTV
ncbi:DUF2975 domain-containing protein [Flavobacterium sp. SM15]|uniref:DUF2975 domain-containing protein n=1 Tax=Flavobacterium sp. SM15 TaxID=2908005 RepID=UPI001EDB0D3B|nr:DUF2975 domain-containing protein [Flavobacterium sp. SM15]MCG2612190.1 DUF2975 domain-containing protein [Flavobacterium sp. SM15]